MKTYVKSANPGRLVSILFFAILLTSAFTPLVQARDREVSVTGSCTRQVTTDRGTVVVTADVLDLDLKSAVKKANRQYERASDAIRRLKLDNLDLQTVESSVQEVKEWEKNRSVSKGFRARMGLRIATSDIQRLGEVTEIAAREELRDVGGLSTFLSLDKLRREQDLCLKEAAENARAKADQLAATLGAKRGEVVTVNESNVSVPQPTPIFAARSMLKDAAAEPSAPPTIEGGRQEVAATVQVTFALK